VRAAFFWLLHATHAVAVAFKTCRFEQKHGTDRRTDGRTPASFTAPTLVAGTVKDIF